jgi:hypothetical protein
MLSGGMMATTSSAMAVIAARALRAEPSEGERTLRVKV